MRKEIHTKQPLLSLIIPAYKQEKTIVEDINNIKRIMNKIYKSYEIIVVVDGFLDKTFMKAKK